MSLMTELEKMAYEPLGNTNRELNYLNTQKFNNNHAIKEQLIKELTVDKPNISYDLFACETHVFSVI
jgi:hypothetical protein